MALSGAADRARILLVRNGAEGLVVRELMVQLSAKEQRPTEMKKLWILAGLMFAIVAVACSSDSETAPVSESAPSGVVTKPVMLQFGIPLDAATGSVRVIDDDSNELVITEVTMTLEDIDFERSDQSVDCSSVSQPLEHSDCGDYIPGPVLLDLDLSGTASTLLTASVPIGTIEVVSFDISVPDGGDPAQIAYLEDHPELTGLSMLIKGTFNGEPFTFRTDLTGDQEIELDPPVKVTAAGSNFAISLIFDPRNWFMDDSGLLIDPASVCPVRTSCADRDQIDAQMEMTIQSYSNE